MLSLPVLVFVGSVFETLVLQLCDHAIQHASPQLLEPLGLAEPLDQGGADGIVGLDKGSAVPGLCQGIVTETAQRPNLGTIVRAVNSGSDIAATAGGYAFRYGEGNIAGEDGLVSAVHVFHINLDQTGSSDRVVIPGILPQSTVVDTTGSQGAGVLDTVGGLSADSAGYDIIDRIVRGEPEGCVLDRLVSVVLKGPLDRYTACGVGTVVPAVDTVLIAFVADIKIPYVKFCHILKPLSIHNL